jgi:hypothetical protein
MWDEPWEMAESQASDAPRVLVAVVPSVADWERVCREGWYRIPLRRAPRRIGAAYLAFYHPKCFDELRWTIQYYAAIQRYSLVPRRELLPEDAGHPRGDDLYYRIELGPLQRLPRPIPSLRLRRITFIHTDLAAMLQASDVTDLWRQEVPKERLWRGLQLSEPRALYGAPAA